MKTWLKWTLGIGGILLASMVLGGDEVIRKPKTRKEVEDLYGSLDPGTDYEEGNGGRIVVSPAWEDDHIILTRLTPGTHVVQLNRVIAAEAASLWAKAAQADPDGWFPSVVQTYVPRHINWDPSRHLSLHSYGIAIDFDPKLNPKNHSVTGDLAQHPEWLKVWTDAGWTWGGGWNGSDFDPMHLQATDGAA